MTGSLMSCLNLADLQDSWRVAHPTERAFTFRQPWSTSQSRLDWIYTKRSLCNAIADWDIESPGPLSDHELVSLSIANYDAPRVGSGRWRISLSLLDEPRFLNSMRELGIELKVKLENLSARTDEVNAQTIFYDFKMKLVKSARARAKTWMPKLEQKIKFLKEQQRSTQNPSKGDTTPEPARAETAAMIHEKIQTLQAKHFGYRRIRTAARDWTAGEKIGQYWMRQNAPAKNDGTIYELQRLDENHGYANSTREMCEVASNFYDDLQRLDLPDSDESHAEQISAALDGLNVRMSTSTLR